MFVVDVVCVVIVFDMCWFEWLVVCVLMFVVFGIVYLVLGFVGYDLWK